MEKNLNGALSIWNLFTGNKLVTFSIYYAAVLYYYIYSTMSDFYYLDLFKSYLIKYSDLAFFIILLQIPVLVHLYNLRTYVIHNSTMSGDDGITKAVDIECGCRKLGEFVFVLFLVFAPVIRYTTVFKKLLLIIPLTIIVEITIYKLLINLNDKG